MPDEDQWARRFDMFLALLTRLLDMKGIDSSGIKEAIKDAEGPRPYPG